MARKRSLYSCSACGAEYPKWSGQCSDCGAWNSLSETVAESPSKPPARFGHYAGQSNVAVQTLMEMQTEPDSRTPTGLSELDRVLGGGLVGGSVVLIGGDPGIGKSTLLLQALADLSHRLQTLYVTGEESPQQVSARATRLALTGNNLRLLTETCVERICQIADKERPQVMVIDSIQTMYTEQLNSAPGAVGQLREGTAQLVRYAKHTGTAIFLVGHVTKEGALAGPRVLEHMVDTVLYFEGDSDSRFRALRAIKNRFGAVNELGVFAMTECGLREVSNPSAIFLSRHETPVSGSVIMVTREGSRPILVEVQALVDESHMPNPRRLTQGLEQGRLSMLLAVLHRHGGIPMYNQDVYINVVGGIRITETAADLAVLLSILSSFRNLNLPSSLVVFGEVGLAGEIRPVQNGRERLLEAAKHGFKRAIVPRTNFPKPAVEGLVVSGVSRLDEALELAKEA